MFFRIAFGVWVGIFAALVQAFFAFFWIFSPYWPGALVIIALDMLVLYALGTTTRIGMGSEAGNEGECFIAINGQTGPGRER